MQPRTERCLVTVAPVNVAGSVRLVPAPIYPYPWTGGSQPVRVPAAAEDWGRERGRASGRSRDRRRELRSQPLRPRVPKKLHLLVPAMIGGLR
jgi:hypothetical protein